MVLLGYCLGLHGYAGIPAGYCMTVSDHTCLEAVVKFGKST